MVFPLRLTKSTDELKKLIAEHPDYPIVVLCGENANNEDWYWIYCSSISFSVGEILDCECPYNEELVETDRDHFDEQIEEWLWDKICEEEFEDSGEPSERYFQQRLSQEKAKYEPYWKKVIAISADN